MSKQIYKKDGTVNLNRYNAKLVLLNEYVDYTTMSVISIDNNYIDEFLNDWCLDYDLILKEYEKTTLLEVPNCLVEPYFSEKYLELF